MQSCIFCDIIAGTSPRRLLYEDDVSIAILTIRPTAAGHTLVIPKSHFTEMDEMDESSAACLMHTMQIMAMQLKEKLHTDGINILQANGKAAGQSVMHVHFHLVPRFYGDGMRLWLEGGNGKTAKLEEVYALLTS